MEVKGCTGLPECDVTKSNGKQCSVFTNSKIVYYISLTSVTANTTITIFTTITTSFFETYGGQCILKIETLKKLVKLNYK